MTIWLSEGVKVVRIDDNAYSVSDARRTLGGIVRYTVPAADGRGAVYKFRAFGADFDSMADAIQEFRKIRYFVPFDAKGDAFVPAC